MGVTSTKTINRNTALYILRGELNEKKSRIALVGADDSAFNSVLSKIGLIDDVEWMFGAPLSEDEFSALIDGLENLTNEQIENLLWRIRDNDFTNYLIQEDFD